MAAGTSSIDAGGITFAMHHRNIDGGASPGGSGSYADQGVCLNVFGEVDGKQTEILRFDCFDN